MRVLTLAPLLLCLALACARPSLESELIVDSGPELEDGENDDDGDDELEPEADARSDADDRAPKDVDDGDSSEADPQGDGGGCEDADRDGVCDADDNCPQLANGDQRDRDGDGQGDACSAPASACEAEEIANEVMVGEARITGVRIDGNLETVAHVAPGIELRIESSIEFGDCGLLGASRQVHLGIEGQGEPVCVSALCPSSSPLLGGVDSTRSVVAELRAPREPGLYYIAAGVADSPLCLLSRATTTRIAALCVSD